MSLFCPIILLWTSKTLQDPPQKDIVEFAASDADAFSVVQMITSALFDWYIITRVVGMQAVGNRDVDK